VSAPVDAALAIPAGPPASEGLAVDLSGGGADDDRVRHSPEPGEVDGDPPRVAMRRQRR
jgi:hypothetical protein